MRKFIVTLLLFTVVGGACPACANDIYLAKQTADEIKSACDKAGGKFSQDSRGYACGTDCEGKPGTSCTVFCELDKKCVAQVMGGRRPHTVLDALVKPKSRH
jgi:hypothetical protein